MASNRKWNKEESFEDISSRIEESYDYSIDLYKKEMRPERLKKSSKLTPYQEKMLDFFQDESEVCRIITSDYIYERPREEDLQKWQKMKTETK